MSHRDYRSSNESNIKIFDERIEFFNPGTLSGQFSVQDLLSGNYKSVIRNKLIAFAFKEIGWIERYGSGITRILQICNDYGIVQPQFREVAGGFEVTLFKADLKANVISISKQENQILDLIRRDHNMTQQAMSESMGISQRNIRVHINKLKEKGLLKRIGGRKTGYWEIVTKEDLHE